MPSNEQRIDLARNALDAYQQARGESPDEADIRDLLSDLLHLAHAEGVEDLDTMLMVVRMNVEAEIEEECEHQASISPR